MSVNPITGGEGGGQLDPFPGLISVALKPFEQYTYKFFTFPKYEFNIFSQIFRTIDFC